MLRRLGRVDVPDGFATMRACGASSAYPGLFRSMRYAMPASNALVSALQVTLQEKHRVNSMAAAMVRLDRSWEKVLASCDARWQPSQRHPDASPMADTAAVTEHLRVIAAMPNTHPPDFDSQLDNAIDAATRLEAALAHRDLLMASRITSWLDSSCTACHATFRDGHDKPPTFVGTPPWELDARVETDSESRAESDTPPKGREAIAP